MNNKSHGELKQSVKGLIGEAHRATATSWKVHDVLRRPMLDKITSFSAKQISLVWPFLPSSGYKISPTLFFSQRLMMYRPLQIELEECEISCEKVEQRTSAFGRREGTRYCAVYTHWNYLLVSIASPLSPRQAWGEILCSTEPYSKALLIRNAARAERKKQLFLSPHMKRELVVGGKKLFHFNIHKFTGIFFVSSSVMKH